MKKRLIALSLVLMLALAIVIPSLALDVDKGGGALDVTLDANNFFQIDGSSYTSYAFVKSDNLGKKLSWKDIKTDTELSLDGKFDFTKIAKEAGYLFLGPAKSGAYTDPASLTSAAYAKIEISGVAEKPDKPVLKDTGISFADDATGTSMTIIVDAGTEYAPVNGQKWTPASGTSITIYLKGNKQDFWLRTKGSGTSLPSPVQKFSVPAMAAAPKVSVDITKGQIKVKDTWEYADNATSTSWTAVPDGDKTMTVASATSAASADGKIYFRVAADAKKGKPASAAAEVNLSIGKKEDVSVDNFVLAAKGAVLVTGDVIVETEDSNGKAKKLKKLTESQVTATNGIKVRIAGDKATLPSDWKMLKLDASFAFTLTDPT